MLIFYQVVPSYSAVLPGYVPIVIRDNHMGMTKFDDLDDPAFIAVAGELRRWSKELNTKSWMSPQTVDIFPKDSISETPLDSKTRGGIHGKQTMFELETEDIETLQPLKEQYKSPPTVLYKSIPGAK
jgi:hypothetical protein